MTIILPVYNTSNYIIKCLNSFVPFLSTKTETIIVDDNSTDNSTKILEQYIKKHNSKNITLIKNKVNKGAGESKNIALSKAKGDYIGFIDSDDYVDKNYFQNMLNMAEKFGSDIVVSDIALTYDNNEIKNGIFHNNLYSNTDNKSEEIDKKIVLGHWAFASTCTKLFKRDIIKNLKFSNKKSDDIIFTTKAFIKAQKITYCRNNFYHYYQSRNSLTRTKDYKKYEDSIKCLFEAVNLLYDENIDWAKIYAANALLPTICYALDEIKIEDVPKFINTIEKLMNDQEKTKTLIENKYIKNNALYNSEFYRSILKYISANDFDKIKRAIEEKEIISPKYIKPLSNYKTTDFNPLISIVIPVYNGENYLKEAIESALSQTYDNKEIIVVDDGSTDSTEKICSSYGNKIRYFKKKNGGVASALNLALDEMDGEYFSWLSHDDLYFEDKLEKQVKFLGQLKDKNTVLFSNYILIDENGRRIGNPTILDGKMTSKKQEYCLLRGCINGITLLIPKKAFDKCGRFDENLRCTQDYEMWHRMLKSFRFVHMNDILAKTRIHSGQDTKVNPKVVTEGEVLWKNMIEDVPDERKVELEGSIFNYYYRMALHLKQSVYKNTYEYCLKKCEEIDTHKTQKLLAKESKGKNLFEKVAYSLKHNGFKETVKIIFKKIMGKPI